jgi:molybdopterin-guanine dinucleotide biosynthesis protein A
VDIYWEKFKTPFICFAGYSGVGKTTLIEGLIKKFKTDDFRVGYYKHDAHRFSIDREGKDTHRCTEAGAAVATINDPQHFAIVADGDFKKPSITHALEQCDCILIEGYKQSPFDKIVFLDHAGQFPIPANSPAIRAVVHQGVLPPEGGSLPPGVRLFHRDAVDDIYHFVKQHFMNCTAPLFGAVFVGGQSQRMGSPKCTLSYNGRSETERLTQLLGDFCPRVFLSARADLDMGGLDRLPGVERINDDHTGLGPVGGLATLMSRYPDKAWIISACDMPFITRKNFARLVEGRDPLRYGTCYTQKGQLGFEPMCAIYEPKFILPLFEAMSRRELSLARIISERPFKHVRIAEEDRRHFMNVNTPEEYAVAREQREKEKKTV